MRYADNRMNHFTHDFLRKFMPLLGAESKVQPRQIQEKPTATPNVFFLYYCTVAERIPLPPRCEKKESFSSQRQHLPS